jgi:hypothetical protein
MKTGRVRDAPQTKQCVCNILCDCDRCYSCIGETSRPLEARIKEHKYNLTQGLFEKSKVAQHAYEEGQKICCHEAKVLQIEPNTTYREYKESVHLSLIDHRSVNPAWTCLPSGLPLLQQKTENYSVDWVGKLCFFMLVPDRLYLSSDDFW